MTHYINKYKQTPETEKELKWKTLNWPLIIWVYTAILMMSLCLIIGGVYGINTNNTPLTVYSFVMAAVFLLCSCCLPVNIINHLKTPKEYFEIESKFNDDGIYVSASNGKMMTYPYKSLEKIKESKNFFIFIFRETGDVKSYLAVKKENSELSTGLIDFVKKRQKVGN